MANQFDANIPQGREKIAFKRVKNAQATSLNGDSFDKSGVLVIDPNMVYDQANKLVDRYVKQEDMVMYCSLKVYKKSELIITDKDGVRNNDYNSTPIQINLLNPLKGTNNQSFDYKNYFTSQWTDFFTSDAANNSNDANTYLLDPETFGIASIDYAVNANHVPLITMKFIDIQGRMLFERGNDPNNPYNIFFTLPYPKFLLSMKGYYGKTVEVQLVFMRANTRFDPSTGNYELTVEFQGDVFSLLQSFVTIYPYVAPYMFLMDDGVYLGQKILNSIYDKQNVEISNTLGNNQTEFDKYNITSNPTLWDLANALKKIPFNTLGNAGQLNASATNNDQILSIKTSFENLNDGINNFFSDKTKYTAGISTKTTGNNYTTYDIFTPISNNYILTNNNLSEFTEALKTFNDNIKQIQSLNTNQNNFINGIKKRINEDPVLKTVISNFDSNNGLNVNLFYFDGKTNVYTLDYFNILVNIIIDEVSKVEAVIEDAYVDSAIGDIGKVLGYQPNLGNILRIIANNMQTFLILLEIISINSAKQLQSDSNRVRKHVLNTTYKSNITNTVKYYSPFPYYYKTINDGTNTKKVLVYPGTDNSNQNWFEVAFVEEIYNSLTILKNKVNPGKNGALFGTKKTGFSTIFGLGEVDMSVYENKKQTNDILGELMLKYALHSSFSGMFYRGMTQDSLTNHYSSNMAQFEMDLLNDLVFNKLTGTGSQFLLMNSLKNAIDINGTKTNLGSFARNYLKLKDPNATYSTIMKNSISEIKLYKSGVYKESDFDTIISSKNNLLNNNLSNRTLYNKLYNTNLLPMSFSITQNKKTEQLSVYADLFSNIFYYCNVNTANSLNDINIGTQNIDITKNNSNSFQGFIWKLNQKLGTDKIGTDFTSNISYGKNTVPALTFNNLVKDNPEVFTVVNKPTENIIQKYKKIIQQ